MNPNFFETLGFETLGWLIVHSAWQFLIIGLLAWLLSDIVLRRCSASMRYKLFAIALSAMVASPALTWVWLDQQAKTALNLSLAQLSATGSASARPLDLGREAADKYPTDAVAVELSFGKAEPPQQSVHRTEPNVGSLSVLITPWLNVIVGCWLLGVCILASRLAVGWWRVERLKHTGLDPMEHPMGRALVATFERASRRLDVRRPVRLLISQWIDSPVVVGAMRSVVLVPANLLGGVALEHVEAILAHELAHVRRYDFLVNLFQSIVETVFFYHPAVWWVSHRMRTLREHCCDDIAATAMESPAVYSRALLAIEELRQANLSPALGIRDGDLVSRVRRLLGRSTSRDAIVPSGPIVATVISSLSLAAWLGVVSLRAGEPVDEKDSPEAFIANISKEFSIELVAVKPHGQPITQAWRPNGLQAGQPIKLAHSDAPNGFDVKDPTALDLFFRYKGLLNEQAPVYRVDGARSHTSRKPYPDGEGFLIVTEPAPSTYATLTIGIPDPNWGPWIKVDTKGERLEQVVVEARYQDAYETLRPLDVQPYGDQSMLRRAHDSDADDLATIEIVAIDINGKRHSYSGRTAWTDAKGIHRGAEIFDLPIEKIDHIEYRLRPTRHWVTFKDISLRSGQQTKVDVSIRNVTIPGPGDDSISITRPAPDPTAQRLGEQIHQQLTGVSNLPAFLISTRRCSSFYSNPDGVIGPQAERSLENLKNALQVRKFDESLSTQTDTWAWKDNQVVVTDHHDYVYEGKPYYLRTAGTWDGQRGWRRDSVGQFGRYRNFSKTFKNHLLTPSNYLYLGDHRFQWATVDEYPSFFVNSVQSVKFANYQSLPDEDFVGERCFVIRSISRREQFWISQESGKLLGCLTFINQGRSIPIEEMESLRKMAGQKFESGDAAWQWVKEVASYDQRQQLEADWYYLNRDIQHARDLTIFQDYREVSPGIELPHTEWHALCLSEGDKFRYDVRRIEIARVTTQPDLTPLIEQALPKKGDMVNDWRFSTYVQYEFDPEMPESTIHALVDKSQTKLQESQRAIDSILKPLQAMVGQPAPKLSGQSITGTELPEVVSGSHTLIHFWAVWCGPCKNDIPILNGLAKNGLNVIGVHAPGTPREEIEAVIKETGMNYPVMLGAEGKGDGREPGKISSYPVGMFPCCVLIDKDGNVEAVGSLDDVLRSGR